ncbi:2246_t:CDS:2, partial [Gigaspora margarita]
MDLYHCNSYQTYKALEDFQGNKTCVNCLTRIKESKKRKREEIIALALLNDKENAVDIENVTDIIYIALINMDNIDDCLESDQEFYIEITISLNTLIENIPSNVLDDQHEQFLANEIVKYIEQGDGYNYVYHTKSVSQKTKKKSFNYWCNCHEELTSKRPKHTDISKQRNTGPFLTRYRCEGLLSVDINLNNNNNLANVKLHYKQLHQRPRHVGVSEEIKQFIRENLEQRASELHRIIISKKLNGYEILTLDQVYFWWACEASIRFRRHDDQYESAKLLLIENEYKILLDLNLPTRILGYLTLFFNELPKESFETIMVDATYNTNQLKYDLYAVMAIIDGTGFPISYCFVENGKGRDIRAAITAWFKCLYNHSLREVKIILSDKDFAQITIAHQQCNIIDPTWQSCQDNNINPKKVFLEASLRKELLEYIDTHYHRHMLIPTADKEFVTQNEIWIRAVNKVFQYCRQHDLFHVWSYLWLE